MGPRPSLRPSWEWLSQETRTPSLLERLYQVLTAQLTGCPTVNKLPQALLPVCCDDESGPVNDDFPQIGLSR
jgi:hypothetical protein